MRENLCDLQILKKNCLHMYTHTHIYMCKNFYKLLSH
ncbi:hypothetical protein X975_20942, partial [Stegodyphus mimosarum]